MRKIQTLAATAAIMVAALAVGTQLQAQPYNGGGYGPGSMMGGGYGGGYGPGNMMGGGYGCGGYQCQGPNQGYGPRQGYGQSYGLGYGPGYGMMGGYGPGYNRGQGNPNQGYLNQGNANQGNLNLSVDDVTNYLAQMIRNPNLKVGDVKEKDADTITAEIVTKDKGGVVQHLQFNRHNGFYQPAEAQ